MCQDMFRVADYTKHLQGQCTSHYQERVDSPSKTTIGEVLSRPTTSPATPAEMKVAGHLVRKMLDHMATAVQRAWSRSKLVVM